MKELIDFERLGSCLAKAIHEADLAITIRNL